MKSKKGLRTWLILTCLDSSDDNKTDVGSVKELPSSSSITSERVEAENHQTSNQMRPSINGGFLDFDLTFYGEKDPLPGIEKSRAKMSSSEQNLLDEINSKDEDQPERFDEQELKRKRSIGFERCRFSTFRKFVVLASVFVFAGQY